MTASPASCTSCSMHLILLSEFSEKSTAFANVQFSLTDIWGLKPAVLCAAGYRITACAATPDQAAFVLSVPRRRPMDETQETLRTSAFPSTHVKEKWAKNLYIAGVAYGRTVS